MCYQIMLYKLDKKYNKYIAGYDFIHDFYIYYINFPLTGALFRGSGKEVYELLTNERLIKYVKRKIAKDGKFIGIKHRLWKHRQKRC